MNDEKASKEGEDDERDQNRKAPPSLAPTAESTAAPVKEEEEATGRTVGAPTVAGIMSSPDATDQDSAKGTTTVAAASRRSADAKADNDSDVTHRLQAIGPLASNFGFPLNVAEDAVDGVGSDVTTCSNNILDQNKSTAASYDKSYCETPPPPSNGAELSTPPKSESLKEYSQNQTQPELPTVASPAIVQSPTRKKRRTSIEDSNLVLDMPGDTTDDNNDSSASNRQQGIAPASLLQEPDQMNTEPEDDEDEEDENESTRKLPARGLPLEVDDVDEEDEDKYNGEEDDEQEVDANLIQMLAQAAAAQGISLDWIIEQARAEEEGSQPLDYPFERLPTNLADVAEFIQSEKCQRILILAGAGMSVVSGIPDFRSAGTGLYSTLDASSLTCTAAQQEAIREDPSFALDQHLFLENPLPLLETKRDFILGTYEQRWKATLAHRFVELLHAKTGKLVRLYTQNIDGLEDQCRQLPEEKVIPVHGTMDRAECARCKTRTSFADFCHQVRNQIKDITGGDPAAPSVSTSINCTTCGYNALKPAIVLFRSSMPQDFFENVGPDSRDVDLLIVIGTSLKVAPANSLVWRVPRTALRLLVNREIVGEHLGMDFDHTPSTAAGVTSSNTGGRDYFAAGNCDDVLLDLMEHLGWLPDLESLLTDQQLPESSATMLQERLATTSRSPTRTSSSGTASGGGEGPSAAAAAATSVLSDERI